MVDLKIQSEITERAALASLHFQCPAELRTDLGLELLEVADSMVSCCTGEPSILLNRVVGPTGAKAASAGRFTTVAAEFSKRGIGDYFLHVYEQDIKQEGKDELHAAGLHRRRGWMKFVNDSLTRREIRSSLTVEKVNLETADEFADIVCDGFGLRKSSAPLIAGLVRDRHWHLFLSRDGKVPAGAGGLFVDGRFGWLDWAATKPAFRRRGSQSAILATRLGLAAELGCSHVFTETGEAVEGDPQHSYGNILKAGFKKLGPRSNYSPRPAP